ncbi:VCBS repeat-containing protein [Flammeovirgaceae bacterium SG7u.111]|nr:VCBS repeat-containing protein [Flammeovirgaceae bacterium SG7u.132]WPO33938.1 VCBS repeat-containing protein [Flammeovirgaceae bacterium SG7u.111]
MKLMKFTPIFLFLGILLFGCSGIESEQRATKNEGVALFQSVPPNSSGVEFQNTLHENDSLNYFTYPYIYMGGGVSIGDINNDGLADIYLTGNFVDNKLYLNKGNFKFEDITEKAGVAGAGMWSTGSTMADVNGDGLLDIYLSVSGKFGSRTNQLYINNGDETFTERAKEFNIADEGYSTQGTFFDYDNDGDLDLYVSNYPPTSFRTPNEQYRYLMNTVTWKDSDHMYRNDDGKGFTDVTEEANMLSFGLTLSATTGDFNQDGLVDLYVSNDFATPDFFYFNNGDGTFTEKLQEITKNISMFGMGVDIGDFNNDGLLDIVQMEMNPSTNKRSKANMASMNPGLFWSSVNNGFHYQYMQNSLQLNRGLNGDLPIFSNVARIAGMSSTDWSWSPLFVDLDNDGWKDVFISNGTRRDINHKDYFKKIDKKKDKMENSLKYTLGIPSEKVDNFAFRNNGDLTFTNSVKEWGLSFEGYSNGSAYGDLDNDGDLDIVVSNIDDFVGIFENRATELEDNHFLQVRLKGTGKNHFALGAKIKVEDGNQSQFYEITTTRGFQSSAQPLAHFGLGAETEVDKVIVTWTDGKEEVLENVKADQILNLDYANATDPAMVAVEKAKPMFEEVSKEKGVDHIHIENTYNDFALEPLLPHRTSAYGPALATGDINGDGLEDFYIGGASQKTGGLFVQTAEGTFNKTLPTALEADVREEDLGAAFFDADGDGDQDLYVVSGGNIYKKGAPQLQDRLYINDGKGNLTKSDGLPDIRVSGSCVLPADYDGDGDLDLFVGGRLVPRNYPLPADSYILENRSEGGKISFVDVTKDIAPELAGLGMVTSGEWVDYDNDGAVDLVLAGEWMPITFFKNKNGKFENMTEEYGLANTTGWWFSILAEDFDGDGDKDFVLGNLGLNYKYKANEKETFDVYAKDFDENGKIDIVLGYYNQGTQFPVRGRQCSSEQIPIIQMQYETYDEFSVATLEDVYSKEALESALHYQVTDFSSAYIENLGDGKFKRHKLPNEVQLSSINGIVAEDFNEDGNLDIIVAGNLYTSEVETPRNDGGIGCLLLGDGKGNFTPTTFPESGILIYNDTRDLKLIKGNKEWLLLAGNNQGPVQIFKKEVDRKELAVLNQ